MREHKYRAWHREGKQMYWFDITWGNFGQGDGWIGMIPIAEKKLTYFPSNQTCISPESVELMEYTGRIDSKGVDICEGDTLRYDNKTYPSSRGLYLVEWSDSERGFVRERLGSYNPLLPTIWKEGMVVGNIYENLELLKVGDNGND